MMIIHWDPETIDPEDMHDIYNSLRGTVEDKIIVLPKDLWVLQDVDKKYLTHIRDEINKILESGDDSVL